METRMIKVKYGMLHTSAFRNTMGKLATTLTDGHSCYKINKMSVALTDAINKIAEEYHTTLLDQYVEKDAEGNYSKSQYKIAEDKQEAFKKAMDEFNNKEAEIDYDLTPVYYIRDAKLTPMEQESIAFMLDFSEYDKKPANVIDLKR